MTKQTIKAGKKLFKTFTDFGGKVHEINKVGHTVQLVNGKPVVDYSPPKELIGWEQEFDKRYDFEESYSGDILRGLNLLKEDLKSFLRSKLLAQQKLTKKLVLEGVIKDAQAHYDTSEVEEFADHWHNVIEWLSKLSEMEEYE